MIVVKNNIIGVWRGMADRDWRPFVYGGLASCAAEFGIVIIIQFICQIF